MLATLTHIDYDVLSLGISRVLPLMLTVSACISLFGRCTDCFPQIPASTTSAYTYLQHLLDYHSKTRTVDSLVEALLEACQPQALNSVQAQPLSASKSPLAQYVFTDSLAQSLKAFLTPGQVNSLIGCVLRYLHAQLETLQASIAQNEEVSGKPQRKKRKVESTSGAIDDSHKAAVAFSFMSRIAAVVLSSIPTRYLLGETKTHVTEALQGFYDTTRSILKDILKHIKRGSEETTRHAQWVAALILRLRYSIRTASLIDVSSEGDEKLSSKLLFTLGSESSVIPVLRVEIVCRVLTKFSVMLIIFASAVTHAPQ